MRLVVKCNASNVCSGPWARSGNAHALGRGFSSAAHTKLGEYP